MERRTSDNTIQKILRNEITWTIFIIGILWGGVTSVVLPLQKLQIQVTQVQDEIGKQTTNYEELTKVVSDLSNRTSVLESRLDSQKIKGSTIQSQ